MKRVRVLVALLACVFAHGALAQATLDFRFAVAVLSDDPGLREEFERGVVEKLRAADFDAVTSFDIAPTDSLDEPRFVRDLAAGGMRGVLMLRLAGVGAGDSLDTVRQDIRPDVFRNIEQFAREVSPLGPDDTPAVVHMAIYVIDRREASLITAGATWLEEAVDGRATAVDRLQDLVVTNMESARPAIRGRLGFPRAAR